MAAPYLNQTEVADVMREMEKRITQTNPKVDSPARYFHGQTAVALARAFEAKGRGFDRDKFLRDCRIA